MGDEVAMEANSEDPVATGVPAGSEHGRRGMYYVAPDSAEPWPDEIWERIDLVELNESLERMDKFDLDATPEERKQYTTPAGFFIPKEDREFLKKIGGASIERGLKRLGGAGS